MYRYQNLRSLFVLAVAAVLGFSALGTADEKKSVQLLNASYDPTRELYQELNAAFAAQYQKDKGVQVEVKQSHGGSASQAVDVAFGKLEADCRGLAEAAAQPLPALPLHHRLRGPQGQPEADQGLA